MFVLTVRLCVQMGTLFGETVQSFPGNGVAASSDDDGYGDVEEQMRQQSGIEIDLRSGVVSANAVKSAK